MAKRQNFVVGSTNPVTVSKTPAQLNNGWDKFQVLKAGDLDGVFNAVSDSSNDSSQEIANAIQALTGAQPTGASQSELAGALEKMREDIETSSLTFKGYIATSAPSSSTYGLVEGNIWINASAMPTTFPVAIAGVWNGTSWESTTETYTPKDFDFFRNTNDNEGYYWFGGQWTIMSTDMSTDYFTLNQTSGKWEIKPSVNLPGAPTAATPTSASPDTQLATKKYVDDAIGGSGTGRNVGDIFLTRRSDNELNGAVTCDGNTYSTTDFTGGESIGALLEAGRIAYKSLSAYAADLAQKGFCDVIGWDGPGTTSFRVPYLQAFILQTPETLSIKGSIGTPSTNQHGDWFVAQTTSFIQETAPAQGGYTVNVQNDQTIPGASVDIADKVAPLRCMIQLAIAASDEALETCTGVLADVAALKYDYVVDFQVPNAANNYTWYRKYKSGWIEQGGITTHANASSVNTTVTLPVAMSDNNYTVTPSTGRTDGVADAAKGIGYSIIGPTSFIITMYTPSGWGSQSTQFSWRVCGMAAE